VSQPYHHVPRATPGFNLVQLNKSVARRQRRFSLDARREAGPSRLPCWVSRRQGARGTEMIETDSHDGTLKLFHAAGAEMDRIREVVIIHQFAEVVHFHARRVADLAHLLDVG